MKTETVPGVAWIGGNQVAYVDSTGYVYVDSAGYHNSPTQTTYHYTDGGAKTNTTAYDALDRVRAPRMQTGPSATATTPSAARFLPVITTASARKISIPAALWSGAWTKTAITPTTTMTTTTA